MRFGIIDHNDDTGRPHVRQVAERLELIEAYDRLGFYAYHLTEHHGRPVVVTPWPHLMRAPAAAPAAVVRHPDTGEGAMVRAARHADDGAGPVAGRPDADRRLQGRVGVTRAPRG